MVTEWTTRRRHAEKASDQPLQKIPAARSIAKLMTTKRDHLTRAETVTVFGNFSRERPWVRGEGSRGHDPELGNGRA